MATSAVIVNPTRVANVEGLRALIAQELAEVGWPPPLWLSTTRDDPGGRLAQEAVRQGSEVVFACGGDGTVMSVAAGLAGTDAALAVVPLGTGNLLALNLGIPIGQAAAVRVATHGRRRRIDLGKVDGVLFTVATGMGFDAQMLQDTPGHAKRRLGWMAYALALLRRLDDPSFPVTVTVDDGPAIERQVRSALVANVGLLPGGIRLIPDARPDDALLDLVLITPRRLLGWLRLLTRLVGRNPRTAGLETIRGRVIEIRSASEQPREADGEPLPPGSLLRAELLPAALTICVPRD